MSTMKSHRPFLHLYIWYRIPTIIVNIFIRRFQIPGLWLAWRLSSRRLLLQGIIGKECSHPLLTTEKMINTLSDAESWFIGATFKIVDIH